MLRNALVAASRSSTLEHLVSNSPLSRAVVRRFVAGTGTHEAIEAIKALKDKGIYSTADRLGEDTKDRAAAQATVDAYIELLRAIGAAVTLLPVIEGTVSR